MIAFFSENEYTSNYRAKRGGSGALNSQSALARPISFPEAGRL
jgi:hypothetical protein